MQVGDGIADLKTLRTMQSDVAMASMPRSRMNKPPLRGRAYLVLQRLRGNAVGEFIDRLCAWERLPNEECDARHNQLLNEILPYARDRVPLYRTSEWAEALAHGCLELSAWPVLEPSVLRARASELRANPPPPTRIDHRRTSGSTGAPIRIAFARAADTWSWAHRYRALEWHGIPAGIRSLRLSSDRRPLRDLLLGQRNIPNLGEPGAVDRAMRFLLDERPQLVSGPPSALFYLARRLKEHGIEAPPAPFARAGGEQLFPFQRAAIERYLGARVIDSYGCTEIGAIAGECPAGSMHIYADHLCLEVLDGSRPVAPGGFGDIVITGLRNTAMPLVRYRVGDRGRLLPNRCACGLPYPVLTDLQARSSDQFEAADGSKRHASSLLNLLTGLFESSTGDAVRELKFCETGRGSWRVLLELAPSAGGRVPDAIREQIERILQDVCGGECRVNIELVDHIARKAGKLRYFVKETTT
jgi:phenylacetate-CoA ligase